MPVEATNDTHPIDVEQYILEVLRENGPMQSKDLWENFQQHGIAAKRTMYKYLERLYRAGLVDQEFVKTQTLKFIVKYALTDAGKERVLNK